MSDSAGNPLKAELQSTDELNAASAELKKHKDLIESADNERSRLLLEKMEAETEKKQATKEYEELDDVEDKLTSQFNKDIQDINEDIKSLERVNQDLQKELEDLQKHLQMKKEEAAALEQKFKIKAQIPVKRMKFTHTEDKKEDQDEHVACVFTVTQRPSVLLKGGQALISFEEDNVAGQILRLAKCSVACDQFKTDVKPSAVTLEPSVKFEVHIKVSKKTIEFSNAPPTLPEERMRDRLELAFSKVSRGGGEVESLDYDKKSGTGHITFLNTGVAENMVLRRKFCVETGSDMIVDVHPLYEYQLKKFQTYLGVPTRTVLLGGIQQVVDEEDLQDHLEIHFQKPSNFGGEVESIKYIPVGKSSTAFFSEDNAETDT